MGLCTVCGEIVFLLFTIQRWWLKYQVDHALTFFHFKILLHASTTEILYYLY